MESLGDLLHHIMEHIETLNLNENILLKTSNILKNCFDIKDKHKEFVSKEFNIKITLSECITKSDCIISINKIERNYKPIINNHEVVGYSYKNHVEFSINNGKIRKELIEDSEDFTTIFVGKLCRIYEPKKINVKYSDDVDISYNVKDVIDFMVEERDRRIDTDLKNDDDTTALEDIFFNSWDFYRKVFEYIFYAVFVNKMELDL